MYPHNNKKYYQFNNITISKYITYALIASLFIVLVFFHTSNYSSSLDKMQFIKYM